jgi:Tol biopolymer transport system component
MTLALAEGTRLGVYEIVGPLGVGGMGEVYRARDTKLGREVALKVLPEEFAADAERMARFEREAKVLASLNHPNIATIHGMEESGNVRALVMELVPGQTLAELLMTSAGTPGRVMPLDEALPIAQQIANGLEYAHERGIVHRDLKPANIKVTPDGVVKILDFGLAKALEGEGAAAGDPSSSPTMSRLATQAGIILGTAAYMSPEQAKGKSVDRRADIWAFGCVVYEMLTGHKPFDGETVTDILAAVVMKGPDWRAFPPGTPPAVVRLLRRCLTKDARERLQAIGEARIAIQQVEKGETELVSGTAVILPRPAPVPAWRRALPWAVAAGLTFALGAVLMYFQPPGKTSEEHVTRFAVTLPASQVLAEVDSLTVAISPDGRTLAYVGIDGNSTGIYLRRMGSLDVKLLPNTHGATGPFFSPDGQWIGFFADGKLKKISVDGGAAIALADADPTVERGGTWSPDGSIIYAPDFSSGLMRVSATGGTPVPLANPDNQKGERSFRWPQVLPDGKHVLFTVGTMNNPGYYGDATIDAVSLATGKRQVVLKGASMASYVVPGELVYAHDNVLYAVPFDPASLRVTGTPVPVVDQVGGNSGSGAAFFAVSASGTLAYAPGSNVSAQSKVVWVDRQGTGTPIPLPANAYSMPRLSPDGKEMALTAGPGLGSQANDVGIYDFGRKTFNRLTFGGGRFLAVWTRDGKQVTYGRQGGGANGIYSKPADGSGVTQLLWAISGQVTMIPSSWTPGDKALVVDEQGTATRGDILLLRPGEKTPQPILATSANEYDPVLSPDGHWLAYVSDESGHDEVYVRAFPGPGGMWQISAGGGNAPVWRKDGRELFYISGDKMMAVDIQTQPTFSAGTPHELFHGGFQQSNFPFTGYDVSPDAKRFVMIAPSGNDQGRTQINVVLNWTNELRRLTAPAKQ